MSGGAPPIEASAAAVVILGFAYRTSEALKLRMDAGLAEYFALASKQPAWLLLTGGDTSRCGETEASFMCSLAVRAGVPSERIILEDEARYTIENALFVRRLLHARNKPPITSVSVCTNQFHLLRSELIFRTTLEPAMRVRMVPAGDGTRLHEDTGRNLVEWQHAEEKQLELLRSECGSDVGNVLAQRISAHEHLALAAKQGNLGALRAWWDLHAGGLPEPQAGVGDTAASPAGASNHSTSAGTSNMSDTGNTAAGDGGAAASAGRAPSVVDSERLRGGAAALHYAVLHAHGDAVGWLLAHNADPNLQNDNGATPLHFVATLAPGSAERERIRTMLLTAGASEELFRGRSALWAGELTPLELLGTSSDDTADAPPPRAGMPPVPPVPPPAAVLTRPRLARLGSLLAFGHVAYAALVEAARDGDEICVREWLAAHPTLHPDGPDGHVGTTALAHAASGGSSECVRLLLAAGADVRLPRPPRANALHYAAFKLHRHCASLLRGAPHADEALGAFGNSALWASLGAQTPEDLARFNAAQAIEFAATLEVAEARGGPRALSLLRAEGLPPALKPPPRNYGT